LTLTAYDLSHCYLFLPISHKKEEKEGKKNNYIEIAQKKKDWIKCLKILK